MPPNFGIHSRRDPSGSEDPERNGELEASVTREGPTYQVSFQYYSLPFLRYVNIVRTVALLNGLLTVILWLCGGDTKYFEEHIIRFKFTQSVFDLAMLAILKTIALVTVSAALEETSYRLIDNPFSIDHTKQACTLHFTIKLVPFICLLFSVTKAALIFNSYLNNSQFYTMHPPFVVASISFPCLTAVEFGLALWSSRAMRRLQQSRILHQFNEGGQELDKDGKVIQKRPGIIKLFSLAKPEAPLLTFGLLALLGSSGSQIVAPLFFGRVVDAAMTSMGAQNV